jgi:hypothetical protein
MGDLRLGHEPFCLFNNALRESHLEIWCGLGCVSLIADVCASFVFRLGER